VNISDGANRILNIIKARYDLKDKSQAIEVMAREYEDSLMEPEFKPEFVKEILRIDKGKFIKIKKLDDLLE